ncbi:hypothetical protein [Frankia sp. AgB32]|uniref:hypothetical protein n=1 Tax=Frankia sp. AgB32 TaxID=631119 RepID=UPI00200FE94A|nr:hypothetical protein [Frankia sp. AgB32]MCK9894005.1 hypothetical protein [Frankia sp. AgB32]
MWTEAVALAVRHLVIAVPHELAAPGWIGRHPAGNDVGEPITCRPDVAQAAPTQGFDRGEHLLLQSNPLW